LERKSVKLALLLCKEKGWDEVGLIHNGFRNLEIRIKSAEDLEKSKPFILKSYEMSNALSPPILERGGWVGLVLLWHPLIKVFFFSPSKKFR
jgi:hypothetical protein